MAPNRVQTTFNQKPALPIPACVLCMMGIRVWYTAELAGYQ